jgi:hypothetical protein
MHKCINSDLPLPDFPMDDNPRVHRQNVEDRPTIH